MNNNEKHPILLDVFDESQSRRKVIQRGAGFGLAAAAAGSLGLSMNPRSLVHAQDAAPETRPSGVAEGEEAVLNFGGIQEPITLDPHLSTSESDKTLMNIYDKLIDVDKFTGEIVGELATEWSTSEDGLTITLKLREGVKFHDLTDMDAEAVKFNFERCIALNSNIIEAFAAIKTLTVVDTLTLQVDLHEPLSSWIPMLTLNPKIISPTAIRDNIKDDDFAQGWLAENTMGAGAYKHVRWDHGSNLYWEAFPEYWRGWEGKHLTEINYRIVLEPGTQRLQLENGDLDVQTVYTQDSIEALQANPDIVVMSSSQPNILYIRLNNFSGPTADPRVRKAISYGFDYDTYTAMLNIQPPPPRADMPIPAQLWGGEYMDQVPEIPYFTYDPDQARSLLNEAGYADGFKMNICTDSSSPQKPLLAELFQAFMADINIEVEIIIEPFTNTLARGTDQEMQKNWDTAIHSWILFTPPQYPDPSAILLRMYNPYPDSVRNLLGYVNTDVQRLTREGLTQVDPAAALELYWEATLAIIDDCPDLVLDRATQFEMLRTSVKGHTQHVLHPWKWMFWDNWKDLG